MLHLRTNIITIEPYSASAGCEEKSEIIQHTNKY